MTQDDFFNELEKKLHFMNDTEKKEAINYYKEYVFEAESSGKSWDEIYKSLGSPKDVAAIIQADYRINKAKEKPSLRNSVKLLIAVLSLCALPTALPLAIVLLAVIIAIIVAIFAGLVSIGVVVVVFFIVALAMISTSITMIVTDPVSGIGLLGLCLIATGLLILTGYGIMRISSYIIVLLANFIKNFNEGLRRKK